ncbi:MAG TPA: inositol-3-phosphate synthase, partial [Gemmataceae bacterium]|nr:inositol-3-phosphate synthase [Gemmataceae bacterium]
MSSHRVGLWLIGAFGGVASTAALGLAAWKRGLMEPVGLVTALPLCDGLDLDAPSNFVVGGHEIRQASFATTARELHERSNVFDRSLLEACLPDLETWSDNVRPGTVLYAGPTIARLADLPEATATETARAAIDRIQKDLRSFRESHRLDQVVVVNVSSTEPPFELSDVHANTERLAAELGRRNHPVLPASSLYAWAALDLGLPYVNFTPSLGASFP